MSLLSEVSAALLAADQEGPGWPAPAPNYDYQARAAVEVVAAWMDTQPQSFIGADLRLAISPTAKDVVLAWMYGEEEEDDDLTAEALLSALRVAGFSLERK